MTTYTIFAGTNGVGKTSMYKSIYYNENKDKNMPGWSNDLIATSLKRDPKEPNLGNDIGFEF